MKRKEKIVDVVLLMIVVLCAATILVPLFFMIMDSFLPPNELLNLRFNFQIKWNELTLENFKTLFAYRDGEYLKWYRNSLVLMLLQTGLGLILSSFVGYALGMYNFKLRNLTMFMVLIFLMTPFEILMIPLYIEVYHLKLLDTMAGILLPSVVTPFMIFFFRQYVQGLPKELADAARIDGAGEFRVYTSVIAPMMTPAFGAMGIVQAVGSWNNFMWPMLVINTTEKITLPVGISGFVSSHGDTYDILLASSTCAFIPVLILFLLFQNSFIEGLTAGGVKG